MNYEELAFVNQQLAGMLKSGIPLEGSLKQLCATMRRGALRAELEALEADLAKGTPLRDALKARQLPEFYRQMLIVGAQANDLPGVLILLADYYSKANSMWTRLKGLMVYPVIVLGAATALSTLIAIVFGGMLGGVNGLLTDLMTGWWWRPPAPPNINALLLNLWFPAFLLLTAAIVMGVVSTVPHFQRSLRWRLPGFKDASLSQFASTASLMLRGGNTLSNVLVLTGEMEHGTPVAKEMADWQTRLKNGQGKISEIMAGTKVTPPLFVWLVASSGDDLAAGFSRAAEIYYARANHRIEMFLHAALPAAILLLGLMIIGQFAPVLQSMVSLLDMIGDGGM